MRGNNQDTPQTQPNERQQPRYSSDTAYWRSSQASKRASFTLLWLAYIRCTGELGGFHTLTHQKIHHDSDNRIVTELRAVELGMKGSKFHEHETDVPASELWAIYGTLLPSKLLPKLLPHVLTRVELISGDGGVGTVLKLIFPPGIPGMQSYTEKFTKVDNENYVKEVEAIEGDILKLGFLYYMVRFEVIPKGPNLSVIRTTIEYEIDDAHPELEAAVSMAGLAATAEKFAEYAKENKAPQATS